jgi:hypothetical protein
LQRALIVKEGADLFKEVPPGSIFKDFTIPSHNNTTAQ